MRRLILAGLLVSCVKPKGDSSPDTMYSFDPGFWNNLRRGEVVITIDEVPHRNPVTGTFASDEIATYLEKEGIHAVFFLVGERLGNVDPATGAPRSVDVNAVRRIFEGRHVIANHSYFHPIQGSEARTSHQQASPACRPSYDAKLSFSQLPVLCQALEIHWTHQLIRSAVGRLGGENWRRVRRWFRPPGADYSYQKSSALDQMLINVGYANPTYTGPFSWNIPKAGEEDFRCFHARIPAATCADRYIAAFRATDYRAIALFHGNLTRGKENYSLAVLQQFVARLKQLRASSGIPIAFPHPDCVAWGSACSRK